LLFIYECNSAVTLQEGKWSVVGEQGAEEHSLCPSEEVMGCWNKLYNEELFYLYSSVNIIGVIKSRRLRWAGHVAHMGKQKCI